MSKSKAPAVPSPSSSVLLLSPQNHVLLLQRVKASSSFASAHVFPGGNLSAYHEREVPIVGSKERHVDGKAYRETAVRETFEESGILLAKGKDGRLLELSEEEMVKGRREVHGNKVRFGEWLETRGGSADLDGLTPFTRWVTPTNVPKRFTTQMYVYCLPTSSSTPLSETADGQDEPPEVKIPTPTPDGGLEHTTARFLPASAWLRLAQEGRIILFPPQFFLLHQAAQHLDALSSPTDYASISRTAVPQAELDTRRQRLLEFINRPPAGEEGGISWRDMCISPTVQPPRTGQKRDDGRNVLGLDRPGPELEAEGSGRKGLKSQCVLVEFKKDGPRRVAVISRSEAMDGSGGAKL
ncbi:hypothetical protein B0A48_01112 [Cryoendolithus antarcticus]|uniref:Nudix hydrolase domain-containing protein n=1 Tax=Cryoendolithus antarcticus TaxID=1507870 RepID=A0A1V8TS94_9PEZI|nr:hypothetical protein B0A48_01112 [Cryoendolithus antarcticus]